MIKLNGWTAVPRAKRNRLRFKCELSIQGKGLFNIREKGCLSGRRPLTWAIFGWYLIATYAIPAEIKRFTDTHQKAFFPFYLGSAYLPGK